MKAGKIYLLAWLTVQWLVAGLLAVALIFLFFSDTHGLPDENSGFSLTIFVVATVGYVIALRVVLSLRDDH